MTLEEIESIFFLMVKQEAADEDISIGPYLPESKSLQQILLLPKEIKDGWVKEILK